jgi:probable HAF family extracellular repeat protein
MEDLGTLGGANSLALSINQKGVVVGTSETSEGTSEAFLWTRADGMRSLGSLGGPFSFAQGVNTHRRVVGGSETDDGSVVPFLWTAAAGMRPLPTLGGGTGEVVYLNEFGQMAGVTTTAGGRERATLWTPTAGPLAVDIPDERAASEVAAPNELRHAKGAVCVLGRKLGDPSRYGVFASRACLAR